MPGIHLNDTERKLKKLWDSNTEIPFLTGISIDDGTAIRGMKNCRVDFKYPITVFCGKNGSGKTTFLQLAALAFHHSESKYRKTFSDFLKRSKYDASNDDTKLTWYYKGKDAKERDLSSISVHKGQKKWMHYDRRPIKKVVVLPVSRTLPANEKKYLYADILKDSDFSRLSTQYLQYLQKIMGRQYIEAEEYKGLFSKCKQPYGTEYSCYNMGIGERIICYILSVLQDIEEKSLIVIDEIEMGLHPEALSNLAQVMQEIALNKKLQIFITSHSRDFLDALPREARIVVERIGDNITTINSPTTIYAMSQISTQRMPEIVVICEDKTAKTLIEKSLGSLRKRVLCIDMGSKTELLKAAQYNLLSQDRRKFLVIWDGDVSDTEIDSYYTNLHIEKAKIPHIKLPGSVAPEKWILCTIENSEGYSLLSNYLNISKEEAKQCVDKAKLEINHHNIFHAIAEELGDEDENIAQSLCQATVVLQKEALNFIREKIEEILN